MAITDLGPMWLTAYLNSRSNTPWLLSTPCFPTGIDQALNRQFGRQEQRQQHAMFVRHVAADGIT